MYEDAIERIEELEKENKELLELLKIMLKRHESKIKDVEGTIIVIATDSLMTHNKLCDNFRWEKRGVIK